MKLASEYGIRMVDKDGNTLTHINEYSKCFLLIVDDFEAAKKIPIRHQLVDCAYGSNSFDNTMPEINDIAIDPEYSNPSIFMLIWDEEYKEFCWDNVTRAIKIFNSLHKNGN